MPSTLTYPGVYIEEVPSSVRTIMGVATSIAAFVGRTKLGPVDEPLVINSLADFERRFGGLWIDSPLSFAVRDFYMNGGGQAVIVRLFAPSLGSARAEAQAAADMVAEAAAEALENGAANPGVIVTAANASLADASEPGAAAKAAAEAVRDAAVLAAAAPNATPDSTAQAAMDAVDAAVDAAAEAETKKTVAHLALGTLKLKAASPGAWGNDLRARIENPTASATSFDLLVRDGSTGAIEQFIDLSLDAGQTRRADHILERDSALVRLDGAPPGGAVPAASGAPPAGKQWWEDDASSAKVAADKGSDGDSLTDAAAEGSAASKTGLYALDKAEEFNLLCIPPHRLGEGGDIGTSLIEAANAYCIARRAVFLIDPPAKWKDKDDAKAGVDTDVGSPSANAALYFPRIVRPNPLRGGIEEAFVPCGAVAGLIARIDGRRGVWKAPAGLEATLIDAPRLSVPLTDPENGELNVKGINCLRALPGAGRVVWGARTGRGSDRLADEWKYLPVRRTALFIEESLYRGTQWAVFEPNDEPLWASIRLNVGAFMHGLFRQHAFQGSTPKDAYFVKCDKDTTTQADIDRGIVNIDVGFAPLKPAEFVVIRLQQQAGQLQSA